MKKLFVLLAVCGLLVAFSSCKKEKTCECKIVLKIDGLDDDVHTFSNLKIDGKSSGQKKCSDLETNYTSLYMGYDVKCIEQ